MLGNFSFCNPTKLYFEDESLNYLSGELSRYGKNVVLIYGGGFPAVFPPYSALRCAEV